MKIGEMIPHFVRATALKKLHLVSEQTAQERGTKVTLAIMQEVADKFTPTKFKAKFSAVFEDTGNRDGTSGAFASFEEDEDVPVESLTFTMSWEEEVKNMLGEIPAPFRKVAVSNTEAYARKHSHNTVTVEVFEAFREELGM